MNAFRKLLATALGFSEPAPAPEPDRVAPAPEALETIAVVGPDELERAVSRERAFDEIATAERAAPSFSVAGDVSAFGSGFDEEALPGHKAATLIPTVYGCVDLIKNALAKLPLRFYLGPEDDAEEIHEEPGNVVALFANPNPTTRGESRFELFEQIQSSLDLNGNAYLFLDADGSGLVRELSTLPAHLTTPIAGKGNAVAYYLIRWNGREFKIPPEQVVHFRYWSPVPGLVGLSPMSPASMSYRTQRLAQRWNFAIYERGGEASGYFTTEASGADTAKRERLELSVRQRYRGPESAGRPIVLPRGMKRESSMLTHEQMKFIESYRMTKADVFEVFGVPPWMKGQKEGGSLGDSGAGTDERLFWENCIEPRAVRIAEAITIKLLKPIDPRLWCRFDLSRVFALQKVRLDRAKSLREALGSPYMTVNEARKEDGLPPLDDPKYDEPPAPASAFGPGGAAGPSSGSADPSAKSDPAAPDPTPQDQQKGRRDLERAAAREEFRKRHDASLARFERRIERLFRSIFSKQERQIVGALEDSARGFARAVVLPHDAEDSDRALSERDAEAEAMRAFDLDAYLADDDAEDLEAIRSALLYILETRGAEALAELAVHADFSLTAAQAAEYVRRNSQRALTQTNATTRERLRQSMAEGLQKNESLAEITARVREVFDDRRANAQTIARTETNPAYQNATAQAWSQSGVVEGKEWVAVLDDVTREAHADADGQVVGLDEPFDVDGEALMYPGASGGSVGNVANCRCGMLAVMKEDARISPAARWLSRGLKGPRSLAAAPSERLRSFFAQGHAKLED